MMNRAYSVLASVLFLLVCVVVLACAVVLAPAASAQTFNSPQCSQFGGYPWVQGGCLNAQDLNAVSNLSPSSVPPINNYGTGAGFGKYWLDSSTGVTTPTLRQCVNTAGCSGRYLATDWMSWGSYNAPARTFSFSPNVTGSLSLGTQAPLALIGNVMVLNIDSNFSINTGTSQLALTQVQPGYVLGNGTIAAAEASPTSISDVLAKGIGATANSVMVTNGAGSVMLSTSLPSGTTIVASPIIGSSISGGTISGLASPIAGASGGTGVNNGASTLTLGGSVAFADMPTSNQVLATTGTRAVGPLSLGSGLTIGGSALSCVPTSSSVFGCAKVDNSSIIATAGVISVGTGGVSNAMLANSTITLGSSTMALGATVTTITGLNLSGGGVTGLPVPTLSSDAATKAYVDAAAVGVTPQTPVKWATAGAALPNSPTYANGTSGVGATLTAGSNAALVVDGNSPALNDRILVKDQAAGLQNGAYLVSATGSGAAPWVLTRVSDWDQSAEMKTGSYFFVQAGSTNAATSWVLSTTGTITVGTTALTFQQFSASQSYSAGTGLVLSGSQFNIANTGVAAASYGDATHSGTLTVNAQGQVTAASNTTITPAFSSLTGTPTTLAGYGVPTTGSGNAVLATSPTLVTPALGTPSAVVLTNGTGLPISGIASLGTGVASALGSAVTGSGGIALSAGPSFTGTAIFSGASGVGNIRISGFGGSWFWLDNPDANHVRFSSGVSAGTVTALTMSDAGAVNVISTLGVGTGITVGGGSIFQDTVSITAASTDAVYAGAAHGATDRVRFQASIPTQGFWAWGADGSDASKFKLAWNSSTFASPAISVSTAGVTTISSLASLVLANGSTATTQGMPVPLDSKLATDSTVLEFPGAPDVRLSSATPAVSCIGGIFDDSTSFTTADALTGIGAIGVYSGVCKISNSITINHTVYFGPQAGLSIDSGKTVGFTRGFISDNPNPFTGAGTVVLPTVGPAAAQGQINDLAGFPGGDMASNSMIRVGSTASYNPFATSYGCAASGHWDFVNLPGGTACPVMGSLPGDPSSAAWYNIGDSVGRGAFIVGTTPWLQNVAGTISGNTFTPTTPLTGTQLSKLRTYQVLDTSADSPVCSGEIVSWTTTGSTSITVAGWYKQGFQQGSTPACNPASSNNVTDRFTKLYGDNIVVTRINTDQQTHGVGAEIDANNATGVADTCPGYDWTCTHSDGGMDVVNLGNATGSFGYQVRNGAGNPGVGYVAGYINSANSLYGYLAGPCTSCTQTYAFAASPQIGSTIGVAFSAVLNASGIGISEPYRFWDGTGKIWGRQDSQGNWEHGQESTAHNYTDKYWSSGHATPVGTGNNQDATMTASGGTGANDGLITWNLGGFGLKTTPNALLTVNPSALSTTTGDPTYKGDIRLIGTTGATANTAQQGGLEFKAATGSSGYGWRFIAYDGGSGNVPMVTEFRSGNAAWTDLMTLRSDNSGRVGILNSAPGFPLDVTGVINATSFDAGGTAGVTCPTGAPSASFATVGGIVTHC